MNVSAAGALGHDVIKKINQNDKNGVKYGNPHFAINAKDSSNKDADLLAICEYIAF